MADVPPAQASSSLSNHNKSQTLRGTQATGSSRRKIVTIPRTLSSLWRPCECSSLFASAAWAKDEPPSPTASQHHHEPPSPGGSYARRSDVSQDSSAGPSGEHRWFPFTRRRPMLRSDAFGAEPPSPSPNRLERWPTLSIGFSHREDRSPPLGEKSPERRGRSRTLDRGLRIVLPTTPVTPHTLPARGRTPGWDSPWSARPLPNLDIYEQLQNGGSNEEQPVDDSKERWWPRTRKGARVYLLTNPYVPLVKHPLLADFADAY